MQLQDQLMGHLMELVQFGSKIRNQSNITVTGQYALDATEKNGNIPNTLMSLINQVNSDLQTERRRINQFTSLPAGSTTGDAELMDIRVGIDGSSYPTAGEALRRQIQNYRDVAIGPTKPTQKSVQMWLDTNPTSQNNSFYVPEVRDDDINSMDTWSSSKINAFVRLLTRDVVVGENQPSPTDSKIWIDTRKKSQVDLISLPEIRDDLNNVEDTWSSSKIAHEIAVATRDVYMGEGRPTGIDGSAKMWIDTSPKASAETFMVPEIRDDIRNTQDTWSSSKIAHEIDIATKDIYVGTNPADAVEYNSKLWIDTRPSNEFWVPEIDDETVSNIDTWSSRKISEELTKIRRELGLTTT